MTFMPLFYLLQGKEAQADEAKKQLAEGCMSDHILLVKTYRVKFYTLPLTLHCNLADNKLKIAECLAPFFFFERIENIVGKG